jgi:hypothetical protein
VTLVPQPLPDIERLRPAPGERGRSTSAPDQLVKDTARAWELFAELGVPDSEWQVERSVFDQYMAADGRSDALIDTLLGDLLLTTAAGATAYRLAVIGLRHAPDDVTDEACHLALRSIVDLSGALCARSGIDAILAISTPTSRWASRSVGGDWRTMALGGVPDGPALPTIIGSARDVLSMTTDAKSAPALFVSGRLRVTQAKGLAKLMGTYADIPGMPGAGALKQVARMVRLLRS